MDALRKALDDEEPAAIGVTEEALDRCAYFLFPKLRAVAKRWPARPDHPAEKALAREVVEEVLLNLDEGGKGR